MTNARVCLKPFATPFWLALMSPCILELERDLEIERRKARDKDERLREKDKEYQKLKVGFTALLLRSSALIESDESEPIR